MWMEQACALSRRDGGGDFLCNDFKHPHIEIPPLDIWIKKISGCVRITQKWLDGRSEVRSTQ